MAHPLLRFARLAGRDIAGGAASSSCPSLRRQAWSRGPQPPLSPAAGGGPHLRPGEAGSAVRLGRYPSLAQRRLKQQASVDKRI